MNMQRFVKSIIAICVTLTVFGFTYAELQKDYEKIGQRIMAKEAIGNLQINMTFTEAYKKLGKPERKTEPTLNQADAFEHSLAYYYDKGVLLDLIGPDSANQKINKIIVINPSSYRTKKSIGIDSPIDSVKAEYADDINPEYSNEESIVVGSVYGGLVFEFENKKVSKYLLGAVAE